MAIRLEGRLNEERQVERRRKGPRRDHLSPGWRAKAEHDGVGQPRFHGS